MKHWKSILLAGAIGVVTAVLAANAQIPGVNSTLQSVFTIVYDASTSKPTYSATQTFVPPTSADTVCTLQGSATKTLRLRRIFIGGQTSTATLDPVAVTRRAAAITTSGTSQLMTIAKYDTNIAGATGVAEIYTYNTVSVLPTEPAIVAELIDLPVFFPALNPTVAYTPQVFTFGERASPVFIRGTADLISVGLNHITLTNGVVAGNTASVTCTFEWTEDSDY